MPDSIVTHLGVGRDNFRIIGSSVQKLSPYFQDGFRIVLVGAVFDLTRRAWDLVWSWVRKTFTVTAAFQAEDEAFKWITEWLEKQPTYSASRDFEVAAKPRSLTDTSQSSAGAKQLQKSVALASYFPAHDTTHWLTYKSHPLCISRGRASHDQSRSFETITLTMFSFSQSPLKQLIEQAGIEFRARDLTGITVHMADQYGNWKRLTSRPHRDFSSVVLEPKVKERLFGDVKDFLEAGAWYARRGIPYRRGYLLYGTPGSGKTSSIHALASELRLDIYIVPLSLKAIDDGILSDLITSMPQRCILLYEDIDAAFYARTGTLSADARGDTVEKSGVTLSGLLNTIDGVQAQEGRILFATTNHPEHLDSALTRPGRMDLKIEYTHATQWQAEQLFRLFYPEESVNDKASVEAASRTFSDAIPPLKLSVAQLQGYLMQHKDRPLDAAKDVKEWVREELKKSN